jgi:glycosyltransferase involved in cell wall biosynthesis
VIHPPVDVDSFGWSPSEDYYLVVSELVQYKRIDLAVAACSRTGRRLKIVGDGPGYRELKGSAGSSVEFCGRVSSDELRDLYSRSRALLQPGEEDFGMVSVEALASGKPIIACGRGGALEIAKGEPAGFFFNDPTEAALEAALVRFEQMEGSLRHEQLVSMAKRYSTAVFETKMRRVLAAPECSVAVAKS